MDVLELVSEKVFLGQEFLTWLWYAAEEEGFVELEGVRVVTVLMSDRLTLSPAQGQEGTRISVAGREASLSEARQALRRGKLVDGLRLGLAVDSEEYWLSLDAAHLGIKSMRMPAVAPGEKEGLEGLLLERVAMIEAAVKALEGLFKRFLSLRMRQGGLPPEMLAWAAGTAVAA